MKIVGLKVKSAEELNNGFTAITLDDGTMIVTQIIIGAKPADDDEDDEAALAPATKPQAPKKPAPVEEDEDEEDEEEAPKKSKKPVDDEEDEDDDELAWSDIKSMDEDELRDLCEEEDRLAKIDPDDYEDDLDGFRKAVAKKLGIEIKKK